MTSRKKQITKYLLVISLVVLVAWDVYVVGWGASDAQDSISRTVLQWVFHSQPALLLPVGYVLGHLLWPQKVPLSNAELVAQASIRLSKDELAEIMAKHSLEPRG